MRAHFLSVPGDIAEAARIDGANTWQQFWRVQVPLAMPALSSLAILLFLWTWNQFLLAIVLVDDPAKRTMAGALGAFQGQWGPTSRCCARVPSWCWHPPSSSS